MKLRVGILWEFCGEIYNLARFRQLFLMAILKNERFGQEKIQNTYCTTFIYYYHTIIFRMVLLWYFCTTKLSGTFGKVPQKYHSRIKILMAFLWYFSESTTKVPQNYVVLYY